MAYQSAYNKKTNSSFKNLIIGGTAGAITAILLALLLTNGVIPFSALTTALRRVPIDPIITGAIIGFIIGSLLAYFSRLNTSQNTPLHGTNQNATSCTQKVIDNTYTDATLSLP